MMDMAIVALLSINFLLLLLIFFKLKSSKQSISAQQLEQEFENNRHEFQKAAKLQREEVVSLMGQFSTQLTQNFQSLQQANQEWIKTIDQHHQAQLAQIKDFHLLIEKQLQEVRQDNRQQLEKMRQTVDEKLQKTLHERLQQSFATVSTHLRSVEQGLGEMQNLAKDVGGLKNVLSNVKIRGNLGEFQLEMLIEEILAPDQYIKNAHTRKGSQDVVEFAIKLPGKEQNSQSVLLPIDAKFPKDVYEHLMTAIEQGDAERISEANKALLNTIKKMAKDISSKYIEPPTTTDFAIMFLPFETIYAEVVRNSDLLVVLQKDYKVIVTGPSTLAAILNSLQMGFKTLAIEKRSSEVWQVLAAVKKEFDNFEGVMHKAQDHIQKGLNQLDDMLGVRSRQIRRKLSQVESLESADEAQKLLGLSDLDD